MRNRKNNRTHKPTVLLLFFETQEQVATQTPATSEIIKGTSMIPNGLDMVVAHDTVWRVVGRVVNYDNNEIAIQLVLPKLLDPTPHNSGDVSGDAL